MKYKFLFFIEREYHIGMLKPLWEYIFENKLGTCAFFCPTKSKSICNQFFRFSHTDNTLKLLTKCGLIYYENPYKYNPDITFVADYNYFFAEGLGVIVNIGHGTISKGLYFLKNHLSRRENIADLICVSGSIHKKYLKHVMYKNIKVTGMPKLDIAFKDNINKEECFKSYNLDINKKTVLYAPTYNDELSLISFIDPNLRKYIPEKYNIIIKLHSLTLPEIAAKYRDFAKFDKNTYYAEDVNIGNFFKISDILISDMSSVIYEYAAFKKPVIVFDHSSQREFVNFSNQLLEYKFRNIGLLFSNVNKIKSCIKYGLGNVNKIIKRQDTIAKQFVSVRDGSSAKKVINEGIKIYNKYSPGITVIVYKDKGEISNDLLNRIGTRSNIILFGKTKQKKCKVYPSSYTFKEMFIIAKKEYPKCSKVLFIDASFECSYNMIDFIDAHFHYNSDTHVISPLISDENTYKEFTPVNFSVQIGYSLTGESIETKFINSKCFAVNFKNFKKVSYDYLFNSFLSDKKNHYICEKLKNRIALDSIIYKPETVENFGEKGPLQFPVHSIYLSFLYLNQSAVPKNFYENVFKRIKNFKVNQTSKSTLVHYLEIGAAYEKIDNSVEAKRYFEKALKFEIAVKENKILGRLYYYLGLIEYKAGKNLNSKQYFKKCLKYLPDHQKAKELLNN